METSDDEALTTLVYVQLELTGFNPSIDKVIVVAAQYNDSETFQKRIIPPVNITQEAYFQNGLSVLNGCLYYNYERLLTNIVKRRCAWNNFIHFISLCPGTPVLILSDLHEKFIRNEIEECNLIDKFLRVLKPKNIKYINSKILLNYYDPGCNGNLSLMAKKYLNYAIDTWDFYPLPMYRVELMRNLGTTFNIDSSVIQTLAISI